MMKLRVMWRKGCNGKTRWEEKAIIQERDVQNFDRGQC